MSIREMNALKMAFRIMAGLSLSPEQFDCFVQEIPIKHRGEPVEWCALWLINYHLKELQ